MATNEENYDLKEKDTNKNKVKPTTYRPSKDIVDVFWLLAHEDQKVRYASVAKLISFVETAQTSSPSSLAPDSSYVLRRLVGGLASDRHLVRPSFAVALAALLRKVQIFKVETVMEKVNSELEVTGAAKEKRHAALGQVTAILTLSKSGKIRKDSPILGQILAQLAALSQVDRTVSKLALKTLGMLVTDLSSASSFKEVFWTPLATVFEALIKKSSLSVESLTLLINCLKKYPIAVKKRLKTEFELKFDLSSDVLTKGFLLETVKKAASDLTVPDHSNESKLLFLTLATSTSDSETNFANFWKQLICKELCPSKEKNLTLLSILDVMLLELKTTSLIEMVLQTRGLDALAKCLELSKGKSSHVVADDVIIKLVNMVTDATFPEDVKLAILQIFIKQEGFGAEAGGRMSASVNRLLSAAPDALLGRIWLLLRDQLVAVTSRATGGGEKSRKRFLWILKQIQNCVAKSNSKSPWEMNALHLLFLFAHFDVPDEAKPEATKMARTSPDMEAFLLNPGLAVPTIEDPERKRIGEFVLNAVVKRTVGERGRSGKDIEILPIHEFRSFVDVLLSLNENVVKPSKVLTAEIAATWSTVSSILSAVEKQKSLLPEGQSSPVLEIFEKLFLVTGFQVFTDFESVDEILPDLKACAWRGIGLDVEMETDSELNESDMVWVDVLTELLVSFMLKENHKYRRLVITLMPILLPHFTDKTLEIINDAITGKASSEEASENGLFELRENEEEEEEEEEEEDEEVEEGKEEEGQEDQDVADDNESEDDDALEDAADQTEDEFHALKLKLAAAMGDKAPKHLGDAETDDEEDDDVSDSEMFNFEEKIAAVFKEIRAKKKEAKEKKEALKEQKAIEESKMKFRIRCLDLVPALLNAGLTGDHFLALFKALVATTSVSHIKSGTGLIAKGDMEAKVRNVIKEISQFKHGVPTLSQEKNYEALAILRSLLNDNLKHASMQSEVSPLCCMIVKMILATAKTEKQSSRAPEIVHVYLDNLETVLKIHHLRHEHFVPLENLISRFQYEVVSEDLIKKLENAIFKPPSSFCLKQLVRLFTQALNLFLRKLSDVTEATQLCRRLMQSCLDFLVQETTKVETSGLDSGAVAAILTIIIQLHRSRGKDMKSLVTDQDKQSLAKLVTLAASLNKAAFANLRLVATFWDMQKLMLANKRKKSNRSEGNVTPKKRKITENQAVPEKTKDSGGKKKKKKGKKQKSLTAETES